MFLGVENKIYISRKIFVSVVRLLGVAILDNSLPHRLHTEGEGSLQSIDDLVRSTLTCYPHRKSERQMCGTSPLVRQVIGVGKEPLVVEDLIANKQEGIRRLGKSHLRVVAQIVPLGCDMPQMGSKIAHQLTRGA